MKPEEQIKALAELDGWEWKSNIHGVEVWHPPGIAEWQYYDKLPPVKYLTSYDAIIPLIKKLNQPHCLVHYDNDPLQGGAMIIPTPAQLCEALLRATGKWKE